MKRLYCLAGALALYILALLSYHYLDARIPHRAWGQSLWGQP